jgi:telomerase protein component 1
MISYKLKLRKARQEKLKALNKDVAEVKEEKSQNRARRAKRIHKKSPLEFNAEVAKLKSIEKTFLTMKDLVGLLHIKPTLLTSAVIGVKYPSTLELFQKRFSQTEKFDETLIGKRMKIKTPITWETELSSKGNSKETWEYLLGNNKVPYLALLRNLRNIVKVDVSLELINKVSNFLSNKENVLKNRSTPLQYLSAYQIINSLLKKPK